MFYILFTLCVHTQVIYSDKKWHPSTRKASNVATYPSCKPCLKTLSFNKHIHYHLQRKVSWEFIVLTSNHFNERWLGRSFSTFILWAWRQLSGEVNAALAQVLPSVAYTYFKWLTLTCNYSFRLRAPVHMHIHSQHYRHDSNI